MRSENVRISVIMGIYNQQNKGQLYEAIRSVLKQTFREFEFIIYNDGSNEEVTSYLRFLSKSDRRIRFIDNPINHGLAYSLNSCIDAAKGEYIARMDGDDICVPERLQIQYEYLEQHPEAAFVGSNACLLDDTGIWGVRKMPEQPQMQDFLRYSPYIHPTVMIRRSVLEQVQGYCADKKTLRCEDYELFMRLSREGYQGHNLQQELLLYREDRSSYKKRRLCYRIDEMKLRYRNFKQLHMLFPKGWLYVLRPLAAAMVPDKIIYGIKRRSYKTTISPGEPTVIRQIWETTDSRLESYERSSYGKA